MHWPKHAKNLGLDSDTWESHYHAHRYILSKTNVSIFQNHADGGLWDTHAVQNMVFYSGSDSFVPTEQDKVFCATFPSMNIGILKNRYNGFAQYISMSMVMRFPRRVSYSYISIHGTK